MNCILEGLRPDWSGVRKIVALVHKLKNWLAHPLTAGLDIDDPRCTALRLQIIREKPFLRAIYDDWYTMIARAIPSGEHTILEIGSGGGYMRQFVERLVTSDLLLCPGIDLVANAQNLPFPDASLRAITMVNVLHHVPDARQFFREAARCVRSGGVITAIEPWVSTWSELIYVRLHHEPFRPDAQAWEFPSTGPLSGANGALPWILFERDRRHFESEFPQWRVDLVRPFMPLRYLLSGGVSMRSLQPKWTVQWWRFIESALTPLMRHVSMFAHIVLVRNTS